MGCSLYKHSSDCHTLTCSLSYRSRAQQLRGRTGGNSSRPASLHVDDFEKAASMAAPAAISITPKTSGITLPPTLAATTARSGSITPRDSGQSQYELDDRKYEMLQRSSNASPCGNFPYRQYNVVEGRHHLQHR